MTPNRLKEKLLAGEVVFGGFIDSPEPYMVEILGHAGFDFAIFDLEHSSMGVQEMGPLILAADAVRITPIVRIGEKNDNTISKILDLGAKGVLIPHVTGPEEAKRMVEMTKYPPAGIRPTCSVIRATQYTSAPFAQHVEQSNREILFFALIEDASAVDGIDQILDVPGIDVILPGPGIYRLP